MKNNYKYKPFIIFFTGLSASGKSSICQQLEKKLITLGVKKIKNIDGDNFRGELKNYRYENKSRDKVGDYKIRISKNYLKKKYIVIVSGVAHSKEWRKKIKDNNNNYFEIYLKCSLRVCEERDYKSQYSRAKKGFIKNFIGVSEPYQEGNSNDLTINTSRVSITKIINKILNFLKKKKYVFKK